MSNAEQNLTATDNTRRTIFIIGGIAAALLVAGIIYLSTRPSTSIGTADQRLEGALRPGSPEFEQYRERIVVDQPEATEATRPIGDIVMELQTTVRNFTGRTINGLEMYGAVVDTEGT